MEPKILIMLDKSSAIELCSLTLLSYFWPVQMLT